MPRRCVGVSGRLLAGLALAASVTACTEPRRAAEPAPSTAGTSQSSASAELGAGGERPAIAAGPVVPESPAAPSPAAPSPAAPSAAASSPPADPPSPDPASSGRSSPDVELAPVLLAADGTPLPQTSARPDAASPGFQRRLQLLVEAIAHDDPERALPAFFPVVAYQLVKAIPNPSRDWETRLVRAFRRDIHEYHRLLGPDAAAARLAGIVINERAVRWMEPGAEGNRVGYHRVTRSRLKLSLANGSTRELELTSLISWRGAWYVVHLHGFS